MKVSFYLCYCFAPQFLHFMFHETVNTQQSTNNVKIYLLKRLLQKDKNLFKIISDIHISNENKEETKKCSSQRNKSKKIQRSS